jgi:type IV pilus assembly protein PilC
MPLYTYKAVDTQGKNVVGRTEAGNPFDLEQRLSRMGLDLVYGAPTSQAARLVGGARISART